MQNFSMRFFFSFYMSLLLSVLMSGWVTFINIGMDNNFVGSWVHAFLLAWPAAFVIAFLCSGQVRILAEKTVARLIKK